MIKNLSKNTIISNNARFCSDALSKFLGLMFCAKEDKALIFEFNKEKIISLHMIFVFYPIDVIFLDKSRVVVDLKKDFKPFTFYASRKKAMYAIELPNGTTKKSRTEAGDRIGF